MNTPTRRLPANTKGVEEAASLLQGGALVSFATETVYGLGADARNGKAVAEIYAAKGRPSFNPLIVHLADAVEAPRYAVWTDAAAALAEAFWPGPFTMVLPQNGFHDLSSLVTAGLESVALRVPAQPTAHKLLAQFGGPIAAPSANLSGQISPTTADHVLSGLNGRIAAVLDDGPCLVGVESTIVGLAGANPLLLREGGTPREAIEEVLGRELSSPETTEITAPGQLQSHYAPSASVRLEATERRDG